MGICSQTAVQIRSPSRIFEVEISWLDTPVLVFELGYRSKEMWEMPRPPNMHRADKQEIWHELRPI